jgi:NTP pyrophosphatase (non-canonical NTP hydrolase)
VEKVTETQKTISEWATKTFGKDVRTMLIRMIEEVKELEYLMTHVNFVGKGQYEEIANECADIYIVMTQVMNTIGYDLHACIDYKMEINRVRKWGVNGDGTGQHIKD